MSELEIINTTNLLNHVSTINSKYEDLAEYTGENYNVFNVLNIYSDELSHSAIIGNLLDAKGRHGQKDVFLKLFLEEIQGFDDKSVQFTTLHSFKTKCSKVIIEKHVGKVNHENGEGGRIDILINDGQNNIIIENKVWAGDQHQQLVRYNNEDKKAPIIYLTLNGKEPSPSSKGNLTLGKEFICISYQNEIVYWIEKCIKEMANKPIIRESLNQYLVLVKQLTNQSTNNKMAEDIIELIAKDENNLRQAKLIHDNYLPSLNYLKKQQVDKMVSIFIEYGIKEDSIIIERSGRLDGAFIALKRFDVEDGEFDLGINIELDANYYFFCVVKKNEIRQSINTNPKFNSIKDYLHSKITNLNLVNEWTIGQSRDFTIGINSSNYFLYKDNIETFQNLASTIVKINNILNK